MLVSQGNISSLGCSDSNDGLSKLTAFLAVCPFPRKPDIIGLSEVWSPAPTSLRRLHDTGYDVVTAIRNNRVGGGVLLAYRRTRWSAEILGTSTTFGASGRVEHATVRLHPRVRDGSPPFVAACLYTPPTNTSDVATAVAQDIGTYIAEFSPAIIVADWNADVRLEVPPTYHYLGPALRPVLELTHQIAAPVERTSLGSQSQFTLDYAATRSPLRARSSTAVVIETHPTIDHASVHHVMSFDSEPVAGATESNAVHHVRRCKWSACKPADLAAARQRAEAWFSAPGPGRGGVATMRALRSLEHWITCGLQRTMDALPRAPRPNGSGAPTVPPPVADAQRAAREAFALVDSMQEDTDGVDEARDAAAAAVEELRKQCDAFSQQLGLNDAARAHHDMKTAWNFFKRTAAPPAPSSIICNPATGERWSSDTEIACGFARVFAAKHGLDPALAASIPSECTTRGWRSALVPPVDIIRPVPWSLPPVTREELRAALRAHKTNQCPDGDAVDPRLLSLLPDAALDALCALFDLALALGVVPRRWKHALVTPLLKPHKPATLVDSYRPVAVTLLLCRTFERILQRRVGPAVELSEEQFGFRPGRSATDALAYLTQSIHDTSSFHCKYTPVKGRGGVKKERLAEDSQRAMFSTMMCCLDYTDAFAAISAADVARLFVARGGDWRYAHVFQDLMSERTIQVRYGSALSPRVPLERGAPQGAVTAPLAWALVADAIIRLMRRLTEPSPQNEFTFAQRTDEQSGTKLTAKSGAYLPEPRHPAVGYTYSAGVDQYTFDDVRKRPGNFIARIAYADDKNTALSGRDLPRLVELTQRVAFMESLFAGLLGIRMSPKSLIVLHNRSTASFNTALSRQSTQQALGTPVIILGLPAPIPVTDASVRVLGLQFGTNGKSDDYVHHVDTVIDTARADLDVVKRLRPVLSPFTTRALVQGLLSALLYAAPAFYPTLPPIHKDRLARIQYEAARLITGCIRHTRVQDVLAEANLLPLDLMCHIASHKLAERLRAAPASNPARARLLLNNVMLAHPSAKRNKEEEIAYQEESGRFSRDLRHAAPDPLPATASPEQPYRSVPAPRQPILQHLPRPLYEPHDTAPLSNIVFLLDLPKGKRKEDMSAAEISSFNSSQISAALAAAREASESPAIYFLTTDGSVSQGEDPDTGGAALLFHMSDPAAALRLRTPLEPTPDAEEDADPDEETVTYADSAARVVDYAARLRAAGARLVARTVMNVPHACSFTMEATALCAGLCETVLTLRSIVALDHGHVVSDDPLVLLLDPRSFLSMLQTGPCSQTELYGALAWWYLLAIARSGRKIVIGFVYSHDRILVHDFADAEAAREAASPVGETFAPWWKDVARVGYSPALREYFDDYKNGRLHSSRRNQIAPTWRSRHQPRPLNDQLLRCSMDKAKNIYRMRVGVDPQLGGWKHATDAETCPLCGEDGLSRRSVNTRGVDHLLCCGDEAARAKRKELFGKLLDAQGTLPHEALYDNHLVDKLLGYRSWFVSARDDQLQRMAALLAAQLPDAPPHPHPPDQEG